MTTKIQNDSGMPVNEALAHLARTGVHNERAEGHAVMVEAAAVEHARRVWLAMLMDCAPAARAYREQVVASVAAREPKVAKAFAKGRRLSREFMDDLVSDAIFIEASRPIGQN